MTKAIRFERTDNGDGASEILTVVTVDGHGEGFYSEALDGKHSPCVVQIEAGSFDAETGTLEIGDFVGLYDLDGDSLAPIGNATWTIATDVPSEIVEAMGSFETGTSTLRRIPDAATEKRT